MKLNIQLIKSTLEKAYQLRIIGQKTKIIILTTSHGINVLEKFHVFDKNINPKSEQIQNAIF